MRRYAIRYQLGATGRTMHRSIWSALQQQRRAAGHNHDAQGVGIQAYEMCGDGYWVESDFTPAERAEIDAAQVR